MLLSKRSFHQAWCWFGFCCAVTAFASQEEEVYPNKAIKLIVPFAVGGAVDIIGRQMALALSEIFKTSFIVENRPGAGGLIALESVANAPADGYTLAVGSAGPLTMSPSLYVASHSFDPLTRLKPVIWYASTPGVLIVGPTVKADSVQALIIESRNAPLLLDMASAGSGSINHLMAEYFEQKAGIKWTHIPFKGSAPALNEVMSGRIQVMMDIVPTAAPLMASGRIKILAVTTPKRSSILPQTPTLMELGFKDFDVSSWISLMAPANTSNLIVSKLHDALEQALKNPEVRLRLLHIGAEPEGGPSTRVSQRIALELERWSTIIKETGASAE
jgi:tripartite-type tricarboxylate transporter receptor subunit TctC